jgi:hypothetical protein
MSAAANTAEVKPLQNFEPLFQGVRALRVELAAAPEVLIPCGLYRSLLVATVNAAMVQPVHIGCALGKLIAT